ncbi:hypothetical protein FRX31_019429 [Thalictrum thalictroides]|uniref:Uncharacterized protein n=1 Tax=Thalictrum thalictroides TaxID=46969 RepID=A0A7J6W2H4_THATH|nr:hypothetical protein FRX31_019429 [Thalictrum thalictroides]
MLQALLKLGDCLDRVIVGHGQRQPSSLLLPPSSSQIILARYEDLLSLYDYIIASVPLRRRTRALNNR